MFRSQLNRQEECPSFFISPDEALARYEETGFHVERGLWSGEECGWLIASSHRFASYREGTCRPVMMPHRESSVFLQALKNDRIVEIVEILIGGKASGLQTEFFFGKPGTPGFSAHQDNNYVQARSGVFVSAWSALEDVSAQNGGLILFPGSHRLGTLPTVPEENYEPSESQDPNANRRKVIAPPEIAPLEISVRRGDVVFLHGDLVHASHRNATERTFRHVLLATYIRKGEKFHPGSYAKRDEVELD